MVHVTLEEPYEASADGTFVFHLGFTPAIEDLAPGSNFGNDPRHRITPGQRILVRLDAASPEHCSYIIADEWARLWFGDWEARPTNDGDHVRVVMAPDGKGSAKVPVPTQGVERDRVATVYGGYRFKSERGLKIDQIDPTPIGPPRVPHVALRVLDHQGRPTKNADGSEFVFRPWDVYGYTEMFPDYVAEKRPVRKKAIA